MTFLEIIKLANDNASIVVVIVIVLLSLIEVSKIKFNPWSWLGSIIFRGVITEIKLNKNEIINLRNEFDDFKKERHFNDATAARRRILRFNDEAIMGSKDNPDYQNNKGKMAMQNIKKIYQKCINDNTFV